jgi:hypothetical protein
MEAACFFPGHSLTMCWGTFLAKALATVTLMSVASPVEGVAFPNTVFPRESSVLLGQATVASKTSLPS